MREWFIQGLLFRRALAAGLIGSYCLLIVMLARLLLLKCRRKYVCYLWIAAFLNFILPIHAGILTIGQSGSIFSCIEKLQEVWNTNPAVTEQRQEIWNTNPAATEKPQEVWNANLTAIEQRQEVWNAKPAASIETSETAKTETENSTAAADNFTGQQNVLEKERGTDPASVTASDNALYKSDANDNHTAAVNNADNQKTVTAQSSSTNDSVPKTEKFVNFVYAHSFKLQIVWLLGMSAILFLNLIHIQKVRQQIDRSHWMYWDSDQRIAEIEGLRAPFVWGIFRPVIFLPAGISETERSYITAHEICHRKRMDPAVKIAVSAITAIYWFHPIVWAAWLLFCQDIEIACDEEVLTDAQTNIKKQYAQSLLKYAAARNGYFITPLSFGAPSIKARIKNVLCYQKQNIRLTWLSRCAVLAVIIGLSVRPASAESISPPRDGTASAETILPLQDDNASDCTTAGLPAADTAYDSKQDQATDTDTSLDITKERTTDAEKKEQSTKNGKHRKGYVKVKLTHIQDPDSPYFTPGLRSEKKLNTLAQKALRELYDLTGYQVKECVYSCTDIGGFLFAKTAADLKRDRCFYSRYYGKRQGYDDLCIESCDIFNARRVWYSDVQQLDLPSNAKKMKDEKLAVWFLKRSAIYRGETIVSAEPSPQADGVIRVFMKNGSFYEVYLDRPIQAVSGIYGPYEKGFSH